jgi:hypothetical protein
MRMMAYQKIVVLKYIENLIAWADKYFTMDTMESINEAIHLYITAANLLGKRPERIPPRGKIETKTYAELRPELDSFSNALVEMENLFPFSSENGSNANSTPGSDGLGIATAFYFCIPQNEKLLGLWDTVEDRLFKIRHCMNIEGIVRELPLYQPPIDPALLVKATAMGLDIGSVLSDISAPTPPYRFQFLVQKSMDLCSQVKAFGAELLATLEKRDAEELSLMRTRHENDLLKTVKEVRKQQIQEARESLLAIGNSRKLAEQRQTFYRNLITRRRNAKENLQLRKLEEANDRQEESTFIEVASQAASNIPNFATGTSGTPPGAYFTATWGGTNLASALQSTSRYWVWRSNNESYQSSRASIEGSHERRGEDWDLQLRLTTQELVQFDKQITAGQIRVAIAEKELENHEKQIEDSNAVYDFMKNKFTSRDLYGSMVSQISGLYFQSYRLAYETAKRAEKAYRMERCLTISNFIQFGYWDSLRKGLLAGERLELDLKRMELAYLNDNQREYELTKSVSLMQLDPVALMMLKETGRCEIELPEALFDMDYPGHYMRRIKSVSLTLPCVVGPYTNINCTLTHLTSRIRISPTTQRPYVEDTETEDSRFTYQLGSLQSIATSHGRDDSGVFELSFKDERFQQFECLGAVSRWRLELLRETNAFNLNTLSDVIVKLHYTAREGGALLKEKVMETVVKAMPKEGLSRFFSAKHEFPDEWYRFLYVPESGVGHSLGLDLMLERFPFLYQGKEIELNYWEIFVKLKS